ncbi:MAG: hypothetical protein H0Z35_09290 [Thermoanaerobacteraceae bacterium]|nr:hypothetical protein [Thermoanaerobacteraceae bacterium]
MASNTPFLGLLKKDPATDGNDTFNIKTMLNDNWDKIDADAAKPFYLKSATYDSANDKIDITFGPGRAAFLETLVVKDQDSTYSIYAPAANTSYYVYLKSDGTFTHNTTGGEVTGAVPVWKITTGATVDQITTEDLRGQLPGAGARKVQDNLDDLAGAGRTTETVKGNADAIQSHIDAAAPHSGHETPSGAQAKADAAEGNAKGYADSLFDDLAGVGRTTETVKGNADNLAAHIGNTNNPHNVNPSQIGAETPDGAQAKVDAHATRTDNPHNVTPAQIGAVNKAGDTMTGSLQFNDANTKILEGTNNAVRAQTNSGYIDIGPQNTNYCHIYTDRPAFYFNKTGLYASGNKIWHAGNDGSGSGLDADKVDGVHVTGSSTAGLRKITLSTANPSGGADGDIWIKYTG